METEQPNRVVRVSELVRFTERQLEAIRTSRKAKFLLYGGAAGGGKSYWLRWALLIFLLRSYGQYGVPSVRVGLFCEDYPALKDRQLSKIKNEFPAWLGSLKNTKEEGWGFFLRPEFGNGFIALRNLDDPGKYDSVEFAAIGVDELTKNVEEMFDQLRKRLRWPTYQIAFDFDTEANPVPLEKRGFPADFIYPFMGGTNPGGVGHGWVKRLWIDHDLPEGLRVAYGAEQFAFVKSLASDNPHNPATYYRDLLSLPEPLRTAYAMGDWNLFEGQFFKEWRRELHVCRPFPIPRYWKRFWAGDWGYGKPFCGGTFAVSPEGRIYLVSEQVFRETDTPTIGHRLAAQHEGQTIAYRLLDPSCWDASRGVSIAEDLKIAGWPCDKADNGRKNGWMHVRGYLAWKQSAAGELTQEPQLQVFDTCAYTIRSIPSLVFDKHDRDDLDTKGDDHAADMIRYGLMSRPGATIVPLEELPLEYAEAIIRANKEEAGTKARWVS